MPATLHIIAGGRSDPFPNGPGSSTQRKATSDRPSFGLATPRKWRRLVVLSLRHSLFRPWLWPVQLMLIRLRNQSIMRALHAMRGELGFDGSVNFNFTQAFVDTEAERRHDPAFQAACEEALRIGRLTLFGYPVVLNEEIENRGQDAIMYHLGWTKGVKRPDPLPINMTD